MHYIIVLNSVRIEENASCRFKRYAVFPSIDFFFFRIPFKKECTDIYLCISQRSTSSQPMEKVEQDGLLIDNQRHKDEILGLGGIGNRVHFAVRAECCRTCADLDLLAIVVVAGTP